MRRLDSSPDRAARSVALAAIVAQAKMAIEPVVGEIPDGWEYTTLGEACERGGGDIQTGPFGSQLHASDYSVVGIPSIMPMNIGDNRINEVGIARITPADAARLSRYLVRRGDIVYSRRGDVERRALVREREDGWLCGTGCLRVRLGENGVDPRYAAFYLGHAKVREWVVRHAHGATMPNLNTGILAACPVVVPPADAQRAIAGILATLDDKIELNRRMSETLESMARALFKSWLANIPPLHIPVSDLIARSVLEIGDGYRAKNNELGSPGLPFVRAGDLQKGINTQGVELLRQESVDGAGGKVSRVGDVAFTSKGTIGRFARVSRHTPQCVYSPQICYWRSLDTAALHPAVLYAWMVSEDLASQIDAVAGQTDMALYVSLSDQRKMEIPRFSSGQSQIGASLAALYDRQDSANAESQSLASIRDALLPRLISGMVRVAN